MPELPEVESLRLSLEENLVGKEFKSAKIMIPRIVREGNLDLLVGGKVTSLTRKGKFIKIEFDNNNINLFIHMGMTGTVLQKDPALHPSDHTRGILYFGDFAFWFQDPRTFGGMWVSEGNMKIWETLGADPFSDEFTPDYLKQICKKRKMCIKSILMNQRHIAGIGNIYANEILFEAGIIPHRDGANLSEEQVMKLYAIILTKLQEAINFKGTTFRDFVLPNNKKGEFQKFLKVYGRENLPCKVCGTIINRDTINSRSTFFCTKCQA